MYKYGGFLPHILCITHIEWQNQKHADADANADTDDDDYDVAAVAQQPQKQLINVVNSSSLIYAQTQRYKHHWTKPEQIERVWVEQAYNTATGATNKPVSVRY